MLEFFRTWAKSLVAKLLLGVLVLAFGAWGMSGVAGSVFDAALSFSGFGPKDLAQVGAVTIKGDEYTRNMELARRNLSQQSGKNVTLDDAKSMGIHKEILNSLLSQAAMTTTANQLQLKVSPSALSADAASEKAFRGPKGTFDETVFKRVLEQNNMTPEAYWVNQSRLHQQNAILAPAATQVALPKALEAALSLFQGETRDVKYFDIAASDADVTKPTDADLDAQYKKSPASYTAPEYRTAAVMSIDVASLEASQTASGEDLQKTYDARKKDFFAAEKRSFIQLPFPNAEAAAKGKEQLAAGTSVVEIATALKLKESDVTLADRTKDKIGGKGVADKVFALKEGEISEPLDIGLSTLVLKVLKVTPEHQQTLEEVKDQVAKIVVNEKARAKLQVIYDAVEDDRTTKQMKFEVISKEQGLNLTILPPISATGLNEDGKPIEVVKPDVLAAIFANDPGVDVDPLGSKDGYTWYDIRSVIPSALKPLDKVKEQVTQDILNSRIREAALTKARDTAERLKSGGSLEEAAKAAGSDVKTVSAIKRNQVNDQFDGENLSAIFSSPAQGFTYAILGDGRSARVMQVTGVTSPSVIAVSPELTQAKTQMGAALGSDLQQSLIGALKKSAGVKINAALWKQNTREDVPQTD